MNKYKLKFILLPLLLLFACSSTVSGVDKAVINKAEKYGTELMSFEDSLGTDKIDDINEFITTKTSNEKEKDILHNIETLYILSVKGKAQIDSSQSTIETEKQMQEIVDYLNDEYQMNIE